MVEPSHAAADLRARRLAVRVVHRRGRHGADLDRRRPPSLDRSRGAALARRLEPSRQLDYSLRVLQREARASKRPGIRGCALDRSNLRPAHHPPRLRRAATQATDDRRGRRVIETVRTSETSTTAIASPGKLYPMIPVFPRARVKTFGDHVALYLYATCWTLKKVEGTWSWTESICYADASWDSPAQWALASRSVARAWAQP